LDIAEALCAARKKLSGHPDVDNPSLESEVLLRYILDVERAHLHTHPKHLISGENENTLNEWISRRLRGEPLAYIIGCREFFGRYFKVDKRVLIPRPETELLVETAIAFASESKVNTAAEIGTGSGAVAVSLIHSLPKIKLYATDISEDALEAARFNAATHSVSERIVFLQGNLLEPLPEAVDLLIANLPYVNQEDMPEVNTYNYEPALALNGGEGGLIKIKQLCRQLDGKINPEGCVLLEIGLGQGEMLKEYILSLYPQAEINFLQDLAGIDRAIKVIMR
jgi:release factor glutamine methyltransferase